MQAPALVLGPAAVQVVPVEPAVAEACCYIVAVQVAAAAVVADALVQTHTSVSVVAEGPAVAHFPVVPAVVPVCYNPTRRGYCRSGVVASPAVLFH